MAVPGSLKLQLQCIAIKMFMRHFVILKSIATTSFSPTESHMHKLHKRLPH